MDFFWQIIAAFCTTLTVSLLMLRFSSRLIGTVRLGDLRAVQTMHVRPTLRVGGVGILVALWANFLVTTEAFLGTLLLCSLPVFVVGLLEDVGLLQSARRRLAFAALSSAIVILVTGTCIQRVGIPMLESMLTLNLIAIPFTILATVGLVHAFNLIDGMNGLSGMVALVGALGIVVISQSAGLRFLDFPALTLVGAILGFLVLNYPFGHIFLGDAGAYSFGFLLSWMAVFLLAEAPAVSPWALVLVFFWPIADTLLAIWRRIVLRVPVGAPDRLHAHHVAKRLIEIFVLGRHARQLSNPLATFFMAPLIVMPSAAGVLLWDDAFWSFLALLGFALLFVGTYRAAIKSAQTRRTSLRHILAGSAFGTLSSFRKPQPIVGEAEQ